MVRLLLRGAATGWPDGAGPREAGSLYLPLSNPFPLWSDPPSFLLAGQDGSEATTPAPSSSLLPGHTVPFKAPSS